MNESKTPRLISQCDANNRSVRKFELGKRVVQHFLRITPCLHDNNNSARLSCRVGTENIFLERVATNN